MSEAERDRLRTYLRALLKVRPGPVAVPTAWNAVYFGFDVRDGGSYVGGPLELDNFPVVTMGDEIHSVPVGAMITVSGGGHNLYAEVAYKEGAHPEVRDSGLVPGWLSGAPATGTQSRRPALTLTERLVCDFSAFGQGFSVTSTKLAKLRSQGRWLDDRGHLVIDAVYPDADTVELDDLSHYARYMVTDARPLLMAPQAPQPLRWLLAPEATEADLQTLMTASLNTIRDALLSMPDVRMWGMYAFLNADLQRRLEQPGVLGGEDLRSVAVGLCRPPSRLRRRTVTSSADTAYTAIGPRLRQFSDADTALTGVRYAECIVHTNTVVADYIRDHSTAGVLSNGGHVRLDDVWQGGGVWRAEHPAGRYTMVNVRQPLGLGWWEAEGVPVSAGEDSPDEVAWSERGYDTVIQDAPGGSLQWTVAIREAHLLGRYVPVPQPLIDRLNGALPFYVSFMHTDAGAPVEWSTSVPEWAQRRGQHAVADVAWPTALLPGTVVTFTWSPGAHVVHAYTTELDSPVRVAGVLFHHVYDPRVVTRDFAPGHARDSAGERRPDSLTLQERILRAVRRLGLLIAEGIVVFDESRLPVAVYGSTGERSESDRLGPSVDALIAARVLRRDVAARVNGWLRYPRRERVGAPVRVLVWVPVVEPATTDEVQFGAGLLHVVKRHVVAPHLRRISGEPSEEARAAYRMLVAHHGLAADPDLPQGYTLVREHERGRS